MKRLPLTDPRFSLRTRAQIRIVRIRADTEDIPVDDDAFVRLGEIGNESTLR